LNETDDTENRQDSHPTIRQAFVCHYLDEQATARCLMHACGTIRHSSRNE